MKSSTAALLKKHLESNKFQFSKAGKNIAIDYDLTDDEVKEIVEAEYGNAVAGTTEELFNTIIKKLLKLGIEHAKNG